MWCRVGDLAWPQAGFAFKSTGFNESGLGLPLIRIRDVGADVAPTTYFSGEYRAEFLVKKGDWLISMDGEFRVRPWHATPALLNQRVTRLVYFADEVHADFVAAALQRELTGLQGTKAYTTVDHLSGKQIGEAVVALPPSAEQARIVARVDELMRLCDALEAKGRLEAEQHARLLGTLLGTLTDSSTPEELAANWQRVADHFDLLLDRPEAVDALEQTILQLAVRGLLVPQDPSDGPALQLRKEIAAEKRRLIGEGRIRPDKPLDLSADQYPFEIPDAWVWVPMGEVVEIVRGITFPASEKTKEAAPGRIACLRTANIQEQVEWHDLLFVNRSFMGRSDQLLKLGDIVMSMANSRELVGKVALINQIPHPESTFGGFLGVLRPWKIDPRYAMALLRSAYARSTLIDSSSQTTNIANISLSKLRPLPFPLPPRAEQNRIVARVDELMRLCDALRQRLVASQTTQSHLAEALVESTVV